MRSFVTMRSFVVLLLLLASSVFAQPAVTRSGALKKRAYQSYATTTLYVDPTGSNTNACTSSGTSACLTLSGALAKLPRFIRHATTINIAAGTYTEPFRVQGFVTGSTAEASDTGTLSITGTLANVTPATGTATGSLTGRTAASGGAKEILTDSGQTWTVDDLRGHLLQITGGTGSGQYRPIASNTATTISVASPFTTAPTAGSTYAIVAPVSIFTGTGSTLRNLMGAGTVSVTDIAVEPASGAALTYAGLQAPITLTRVRLTGTNGFFSASPPVGSAAMTLTDSVLVATSGTGFGSAPFSVTQLNRVFIRCTTSCFAGLLVSSRSGFISLFTGTVAGTWTAGAIRLLGSATVQSTGLWVDCASAATNAIVLPAPNDTAAYAPSSGWTQNTGPYISGCGVGYQLSSPSLSYIDTGTVFTNTTTAVELTGGARVHVEAGTTSVGVTTFLTVDGASYTAAELVTFTSITGPKGSVAIGL